MPRRLAIDWVAVKSLFVTDGRQTYASLGQRFNCSTSAVKVRAYRERWVEARAQRSELLLAAATRHSVDSTAKELAKYSEQDLIAAKVIRARAANKLQSSNVDRLSCADLARLAATIEGAQKVAHRALGALTSTPTMGTTLFIDEENFNLEELTDEELLAFRQLFSKAMRSVKPSGETVQ